MLGNFPIWDCSMKGAVHFILTIPSGHLFGREKRNDRGPWNSGPVFSTGVIKLQLSGWQRVASASQPYAPILT